MNKEFAYIILLPAGSLLWMLGGYRWKWMRRFLLPAVFCGAAVLFGVPWHYALMMAVIGCISFSLPYGEHSGWDVRVVTALSFGMVSLPLGITLWQLAAPIVFLATWVLSNKNNWQWKICEAMTGFAVALPIAELLYRR